MKIRPHGVGVGFLKQAQNLLNSGLLTYSTLCYLFTVTTTNRPSTIYMHNSDCMHVECRFIDDVTSCDLYR